MENNQKLIKELNQFLKGTNMGIESFKDYPNKTTHPVIKEELERLLSTFDHQKQTLAAMIFNLDGVVDDSIGIGGEVASFFEKIKDVFINNDEELLNQSVKSMEMGIKEAMKVLDSIKEINATSNVMSELTKIMDENKNSLSRLKVLADKLEK